MPPADQMPVLRFKTNDAWVTSTPAMMRHCDNAGEMMVNAQRYAMAAITELELFLEGIEEQRRNMPSYEIVPQSAKAKRKKA